MNLSLRTRLLSGMVLGTAVLLALFCVTMYSLTRRTLIRHFDDSLLATARLLSAVIEDKGLAHEDGESANEQDAEQADRIERELELEFNVRMTPEFVNLHGGEYYQFWTQEQDITIRSPSLGDEDLPDFENETDNPFFGDCFLPRDKSGRAIRLRFVPRSEDNVSFADASLTLVVARDSTELVKFLAFFRWLLINASLGIVVLSAVIGLLVSGTGLRPIHALAGTIRTVNEQTLDQSFSTETCPIELHPICDCLNALMQRIRYSFERERRFNADVAHELRTPLAGIQTTIEVNLARRRDPDEYQQALRDCLAIARSMQKMVDTLLSLSRIDSQKLTIRRQSVALRDLIESRWRTMADKAFDRGLTFENDIGPDLRCNSDPDHLSMILSNVLENAVEYCNPSGRIRVRAESADDSIVLSISNTGCTLNPEAADRVFDAFWRQDPSRTNTGNHCGIGLAVVRKIADALGIEVQAAVEENNIFTLIVRFPCVAGTRTNQS